MVSAPRIHIIIKRCIKKLQGADLVHGLLKTNRSNLLVSEIVRVSLGFVEHSGLLKLTLLLYRFII